MTIRAICFDIGETLANETRIWTRWADWLGILRLTFLAALGSVIERGESHMQVFELFRPGFDLEREEAAMAAAGTPNIFDASDLYPDVVPCLQTLKLDGYALGIVGNQPPSSEQTLRDTDLPVDFIETSATLGAIKSSPELLRLLRRCDRLRGQSDRVRRRPRRQRRAAGTGGGNAAHLFATRPVGDHPRALATVRPGRPGDR